MYRRTSRRTGTTSDGFTIVELLIVVVVIAILAAITIVAYNGVTNRAKDSAAQSAASSALKKVKTYTITNGGVLPADLATTGLTNNGGISYQYDANNSTNPPGFCITATQGGRSAYVAENYTSNGNVINQASPVSGACPGHSPTGNVTVRNLVTNPSFENDTSGWTSSSATISRQTTWASAGVASLRVTNTGTGNAGDFRTTSTASSFPFGMQPGKTYTISARLYFTVAPTGGHSRAPGVLTWVSTNGSSWTENFGPKAPTTPGTYTVSHTITIPADATGVLVGFGAASSTASQQFFYDSIMVTEGSTVYAYGDGTTPGWTWLGNPHESASVGPAQ